MFEAAEHYWNRFDIADDSRLVYLNATEFGSSYPGLSQHLPLALLGQLDDQSLPFRHYVEPMGEGTCLYPLGLATPSYIDGLASGVVTNARDEYDYRYLSRYSSNCGVAIGANQTEAIIHGLLECVEGDAFSRFLTKNLLIRTGYAPRVVDQATLPSDLSHLVWRLEKESNRIVSIFELQNRFDIPAFCTMLDCGPSMSLVYGCGASLSRHLALSRSLDEAAQMLLIKGAYSWARDFDGRVAHRLRDHPSHLRCAKLGLSDRYRNDKSEVVPYSETASIKYPSNTDDYLARVCSILKSSGAKPYTTELMRFKNGVSISHSFFEGQDYFSLVTGGNVVFPQPATLGLTQSIL